MPLHRPLLLLIIISPPLLGINPFRTPPRAHQFLGKRSFAPSTTTTVAELVRANPLLASLSMFRGGELLGEPVDITSNRSSVSMVHSIMNASRRKTITATKRRKSNTGRAKELPPPVDPPLAAQMDNFDAIYQIFNATLFDLAEGEGDGGGRAPEQQQRQQPLWRLALPWGVSGDGEEEAEEAMRRKGMTRTEVNRREGKFHEREEEGEEDTTTPFEVTESLRRALSSVGTTTTTTEKTLVGQKNQSQEEFPVGVLNQRPKYPWERERGEQPLPPPPSPLPSPVVPGASFYVDQHVSRGSFGRDSAPDLLVYDPNILQSMYGYSGMLPQMLPDGRMVRPQKPKQQRGVTTGHLSNWTRTPLAPLAPPTLSPPFSFSTSVFFIPAPPRLSVAKLVAQHIDTAAPRVHGLTQKKAKLGYYWPLKSKEKTEREQEQLEMTTTTRSWQGAELVPMGGNHLKWVPAEVAARPVLDPSLSFASSSRWPCMADPPALLLADSPPPLAACFRRVRQCALHAASPPLERRVAASREHCARFCAENVLCAALTFARSASLCDIFDVRNGTGTARLLHHRDFDYLEPIGGGKGLSECWEKFEEDRGAEEKGNGAKMVLVDSGDGETERDEGSGRTGTASPALSTTAPKAETCTAERDIVVFKSQGYRLAGPAGLSRKRRNVGEPPPQQAEDERHTREQKSSETECIFSCLVNLAQGRHPFDCLAATFDSVQGRCVLHGLGSTADGSVHLVPDPSFSYYEKGCVQMDLVELCRGFPIVRYPQKTLLGFALGSRHADSLVGCLELCWAHNLAIRNSSNSPSLPDPALRRRCRSVAFFFEESGSGGEGGHNCMLNTESRDSAPAFFVDEHEALVDYASFDACYELEAEEEEDDAEEGEAEEEEGGEEDGSGKRMDMAKEAVMATKKKILPKVLKLRPLPDERRRTEARKVKALMRKSPVPRAQVPEGNPRTVVAELKTKEQPAEGKRRQRVDGQTGRRPSGRRRKRRRASSIRTKKEMNPEESGGEGRAVAGQDGDEPGRGRRRRASSSRTKKEMNPEEDGGEGRAVSGRRWR